MTRHVNVNCRGTLNAFLVQRLGQDKVLFVDPQRPITRGKGQVDVLTNVTLDPELADEAAHSQVLFDKEACGRTTGLGGSFKDYF